MQYFLIVLSTLFVAGQFTFNKMYQKYVVKSTAALLLFPVLTGIIAVALFLSLNGFSLAFGAFSFGIAVGEAIVLTLCMLCGIFVVKFGRVSVYTVFMMLGGMLLPFIYGLIFLGEPLSVFKIIGILVLVAGLILSALPDKNSAGEKPKPVFYLLCFAVFCLNGGVSILSKVHQINADAIGTMDFMVWLYLMQLSISALCFGVYMLFFRKKNAFPASENLSEKEERRRAFQKSALWAFLISLGYMLFSGFGYLLQLNAAKEIEASLLYPIVTGGSILFSTLTAWAVFKEKINLPLWISLALTFIGTVLFMF